MSVNLKEINICILGNVNKYVLYEIKYSFNYYNVKCVKVFKRLLLYIYD